MDRIRSLAMPSCLVVIDVQQGFITPDTAHIPERICSLIKAVPFDHVIATRFINEEGSPFVELMGWRGMMTEGECALCQGIGPRAERVFTKYGYSCFIDEFSRFLVANQVTDLAFAGIDTDCCVLQSAVDAFECGYRPVIESSQGAPREDAEGPGCARSRSETTAAGAHPAAVSSSSRDRSRESRPRQSDRPRCLTIRGTPAVYHSAICLVPERLVDAGPASHSTFV